MKVRIREGNDFDVVWAIKRAGQPENLSAATSMKLTLVVYGLVIEHSLFTVTDNVLSINIPKEVATIKGDYRLVFEYTLPDAGQPDGDLKCKTDVVPFRIVPFTADADDVYTVNTSSDIAFGFKGDKGDDGDDAYQIWLDLGNEGTYEDFIAYLRQPATDAAESISELEQEISENEGERVLAENERKSAELARANAEGDETKGRIKAESERVIAEGIRNENEIDRINAEGIRDANETDRINAESDRVDAEELRELAEGERLSSEIERQNNEDSRIDAEELRVQAEVAREEAEGLRQTNTATAIQDANDATTAANTAAGLADTARTELTTAVNTKLDEADAKIEEMDETLSTYDGRVTQVESDISQLAGDVEQLAYVKINNEAVNGNFENGLIGPFRKVDGGVGGASTLDINSSTPISGNYDIRLTIITPVADETGRPIFYGLNRAANIGEKIYIHFYAKILSGIPRINRIHSGAGAYLIYGGDVVNGRNTRIIDVSGTGDQLGLIYFNSLSAWDMQMDNLMRINLTETFGAGNEPTKEEMDLLFSTLGTDYFEGEITIPAQKVMQWQLKLIRKNKNAIIALGGTII